jgi:hypothetical protein
MKLTQVNIYNLYVDFEQHDQFHNFVDLVEFKYDVMPIF